MSHFFWNICRQWSPCFLRLQVGTFFPWWPALLRLRERSWPTTFWADLALMSRTCHGWETMSRLTPVEIRMRIRGMATLPSWARARTRAGERANRLEVERNMAVEKYNQLNYNCKKHIDECLTEAMWWFNGCNHFVLNCVISKFNQSTYGIWLFKKK